MPLWYLHKLNCVGKTEAIWFLYPPIPPTKASMRVYGGEIGPDTLPSPKKKQNL